MTLSSVKKIILGKIKPSPKEEKEINVFIEHLLRVAKVVSKAQPVITGSLGRGTWLRGDHDIDLFLMFDRTIPREALEKTGMDNAKSIAAELKGKVVIKYAEHPYIRASFNSTKVDIVPCYKIENGEKIISAVDRSPLHVDYVLKKLKPLQRDEVRLLKQFCKGIGVYGSDAKTMGVSGYICELLIIKYGSFEKVLKSLSSIIPGSVMDIEEYWKPAEHLKLREIFKSSPLIIIDPVDKDRNVAASLSCENFAKLRMASERFLKKPSVNLFIRDSNALDSKQIRCLKERGTKFFAVSFQKPDIIDDILYPQMRKVQARLLTLLKQNEFRTIRSYVFANEKTSRAFLVFEMECWEMPFINNMVGPPIFSIKNSRDFLKKYEKPLFGPYIDGQNWAIEKQRLYKSATEAVHKFLDQKPDKLMINGVPEQLSNDISKSWLMEHNDFWKAIANDKEFSRFLREKYFNTV